ncbi:MAG: hypothetical protein QOI36_5099, partial [Pseudonocardiales bacterium]|nr:hypothetical protein [Pseudonocardiales bacterium]
NIYVKGGGAGLNYTTNAQLTKAPLISGGVTTGSGANLAVYFFSAAAVGVKGASSLSFIFDKADRAFGIDTAGTTGGLLGSGEGLYVLTLSRGTANSFDSWADTSLHLQGGKAGQTAVVSYKTHWDATKPIPIIVTSPSGSQGLQEMKPEK